MTGSLEIRGLKKAFNTLVVTDIEQLSVSRGEVHALIGPNGAGKSSLINQISGAWMPDRGSIRLSGEDITRLSAPIRARRGIARIFQISTLCLTMTVLEHVVLALQCRGDWRTWPALRLIRAQSRYHDEAASLIRQLGLDALAARPVKALAHGDKRFLELAIALAMKPVLLLLDEPMAGMGRDDTARMTDLLRTLKSDVAMLLVEHDMDSVFALADRVSVLVNGVIVETGTPAAIQTSSLVRQVYLGDEHG